MDLFSFEKLDAYKAALRLVKKVYMITDSFPNHEKYALCNQINRAITSVPSNIAESCGRRSYKEKIHFLEIAYGSLLESYCQLQIAVSVDYISVDDVENLRNEYFDVSRLLNGLSQSYYKLINS